MAEIRSFRELNVYKNARESARAIFEISKTFPREERYGLTSQIRLAAVSIPANVAEGAGRYSNREFAHFLSNAQGPATELETELIISNRLGYLDDTTLTSLVTPLDNIGRLITGLSKHLSAGPGQ